MNTREACLGRAIFRKDSYSLLEIFLFVSVGVERGEGDCEESNSCKERIQEINDKPVYLS